MKKVLLFVALVATSLSVFAQGGLTFPGWREIGPSFSTQARQGTAYIFICPVSKDVNGAISVDYNIILNPYIQTERGPERISVRMDGRPPADWLVFTNPAYGAWVTNTDGSQCFKYRNLVAIAVSRERVFDHPIRGVNPADPQYKDSWYTQYQLQL